MCLIIRNNIKVYGFGEGFYEGGKIVVFIR